MKYNEVRQKLVEQRETHDEFDQLLCTVPGCRARWSASLQIGNGARGMCSRHAWGRPGLNADPLQLAAEVGK